MKEVSDILNGGLKIAPHVFIDKNEYHLFFASPFHIQHWISDESLKWRHLKPAVISPWPMLRDPHVIKENDVYYLYLTDFANRISVYESKNLDSWKSVGTAFLLTKDRSLNSACESPYILKLDKVYLLFTTIVPSPFRRKRNYCKTLVFYSGNFLNFGNFPGNAKLVCYLDTHAPEIIEDGNDLFITTCGWKGFPKPKGAQKEGVYIRKIRIFYS